jgi:hypothetical protein
MPANPAASALAAVELVTNCAIWLSGSARLSASNIRQTPAQNLFTRPAHRKIDARAVL